MKKVESSNVDTIHYEPNAKRLEVTFKNGRTYHYQGVSQQEYDALENADSIGKHLHKHIKGRFSGVKQT
jgi:hypothetical protein